MVWPSELLTMPPNNGNGRTEADIAQSNGAKLLGATVRDVPKLADAGAGQREPRGCALSIMHGTADKGVPLREKLDAKLRAHGVESTLLALEGAGHGGRNLSRRSREDYPRFSRNI